MKHIVVERLSDCACKGKNGWPEYEFFCLRILMEESVLGEIEKNSRDCGFMKSEFLTDFNRTHLLIIGRKGR